MKIADWHSNKAGTKKRIDKIPQSLEKAILISHLSQYIFCLSLEYQGEPCKI